MEKKIVGLNTYFKSLEYENFDEYEFSARISLLDYDAVVINAEYLITCYSTSYDSSYQNKPCLSDYNSAQIVEDFKKIEGQIKELLKQGRNVFVLMGNNDNCYIYTGEKQYSGTGRNARQTNIVREFNAYSFLPIKLNVTEVVGERIDICCSSPYRSDIIAKYGEVAIVAEIKVFDKAQDILKGRHDSFKITHERQSNKYLFSTLIKCKECGWSFRRTVRQYKNTYVRWVCSGHNGKGADSCPNAVTVDEEELIQALQEYFQEILSKKKKVINYVIKEFQRVYKAKDENIEYEKQLNAELNKLHKSREKYMDMYTDDLISREELNEKIGGMRKEIERLENELKMVSYHLTKGEQLEAILNSTFKQLEDITDVHEMTNAQLKRLINKIEVDKDGNVDIYLHLIGDLGLDETVLIEGDKNTEEKGTKKVPNSYNHT